MLRTTWHRVADDCAMLPGGITAATWAVTVGTERYLVTVVPAARRPALEAGLAVAEYLAGQQGTVSTVVRAVDGGLVGTVRDEVAALLLPATGRPLDPADPVDQQWWGDALGAVHRKL